MRTRALFGLVVVLCVTAASAAPPEPVQRRATVRMPQLHGGVFVRGGGEVFDVDGRDGRVLRHIDHRVVGLTADTVPTVARAEVLEILAPRAVRSLELVVLPWRPGGVLAWEALVAGTPPRRVSIDAKTGKILADVSIAHDARGKVYAKHPAAGDPIEVDLPGLPEDAETLSGPDLFVTSMVFDTNGTPESKQHAVADADGNFLYAPDPAVDDDGFAEVNAWWHVSQVAAFFKDKFGVDPTPPTYVTVNYREAPGEPYLNAFAYLDPMSGQFVISAGQADGLDMAYDGMTLVHEYGHPIFDALNDISENNTYPISSDARGFHPAPHAINEGASDYWAASMFDDPIILALFDEEISSRRLDNDRRCPNDVWGEAHLDAPLVSGTFWKVRERIGKDAADRVVYDTLSHLSASPTFDELAQRIRDATGDLAVEGVVTGEDAGAVARMLDERGLVGCGREIDIADGVPFTANMPGAATAAALTGTKQDLCEPLRTVGVQIPLAFSYRTTAPDVDASKLEALEITIAFVRADGKPLAEDDLQYQLLVRRNEPVGLEVLTIPFSGQEFQLPIRAAEFDFAAPDQPTNVRITAADLELAPGAVYYLNLLALNCPLTTHTVTAHWVVTPEPQAEPEAQPEPSAEPTAESTVEESATRAEGGGCAGSGEPGGTGVVLVLAVALMCRRRSLALS